MQRNEFIVLVKRKRIREKLFIIASHTRGAILILLEKTINIIKKKYYT